MKCLNEIMWDMLTANWDNKLVYIAGGRRAGRSYAQMLILRQLRLEKRASGQPFTCLVFNLRELDYLVENGFKPSEIILLSEFSPGHVYNLEKTEFDEWGELP